MLVFISVYAWTLTTITLLIQRLFIILLKSVLSLDLPPSSSLHSCCLSTSSLSSFILLFLPLVPFLFSSPLFLHSFPFVRLLSQSPPPCHLIYQCIIEFLFLFWQVLNEFFHNVCELDLVFNFYKVTNIRNRYFS